MAPMPERDQYLAMDDAELLGHCDVQLYKASGPGGQHRNKTTSAVRLKHRATGVTATAADSRSQHDNKRMALRRLRMNLACRVRRPVAAGEAALPEVLAGCLVGGKQGGQGRRLQIGRKDARFWPVAAIVLDLLEAHEGRLAEAADVLAISTSNLASLLRSDRHLLAAAQAARKRFGLGPVQ